jgi:uncharacterized membrane protein
MYLAVITIINTLLMAATVAIHYELLRTLSMFIPKLPVAYRLRIVIGVLGALVAHVIEVWLFGLAFYGLIRLPPFGALKGNFEGDLLDCVYFSFTNYTTLGYGDIEPVGLLRFTTGIESLTGLVMITWTASFLFYEMQRYWQER